MIRQQENQTIKEPDTVRKHSPEIRSSLADPEFREVRVDLEGMKSMIIENRLVATKDTSYWVENLIKPIVCSTNMPLASTRWVRLTFSILCPLNSKQPRQ